LRFPENILRSRLKAFQEKFSSKGLDGVMLRTLSSYAYFTGIKWLRPALFIPPDGEPIAFVARGEEEGFKKATWIRNLITYADGGELMANVISIMREFKVKKVGMEFGVERDAYVLFYEMFKRLNRNIEVIDVGPILAEMRMIKDKYELNVLREAGRKAEKALEKVLSIIRAGITETEIAAEAYSVLYKLGAEKPKVYVNAGPHPRIHSEPLSDNKVKKGTFITIVIGADYNGYYANISRSLFIGDSPSSIANKLIECSEEVYKKAIENTRPGRRFSDVIKLLDEVYSRYGLIDKRVVGYAHGVGLQIEEAPITTIVPAHRGIVIQPGMVLAMVHAPIVYEGLGQVKKEDTFAVKADGSLEPLTLLK